MLWYFRIPISVKHFYVLIIKKACLIPLFLQEFLSSFRFSMFWFQIQICNYLENGPCIKFKNILENDYAYRLRVFTEELFQTRTDRFAQTCLLRNQMWQYNNLVRTSVIKNKVKFKFSHKGYLRWYAFRNKCKIWFFPASLNKLKIKGFHVTDCPKHVPINPWKIEFFPKYKKSAPEMLFFQK